MVPEEVAKAMRLHLLALGLGGTVGPDMGHPELCAGQDTDKGKRLFFWSF